MFMNFKFPFLVLREKAVPKQKNYQVDIFHSYFTYIYIILFNFKTFYTIEKADIIAISI